MTDMDKQIADCRNRIAQARGGGRPEDETRAMLLSEGFAAAAVIAAFEQLEATDGQG